MNPKQPPAKLTIFKVREVQQVVDKKRHNQRILNYLEDLIFKCIETNDIDEKERISGACASVVKEVNKINKQVSWGDIQELLKRTPETTEDIKNTSQLIKTIIGSKAEDSGEEDDAGADKNLEVERKKLEYALNKIKEKSPHLSYYLGPLSSKKDIGLSYHVNEFYFVYNDDIKWDFG